ncbi:hypothetical protein [Pseudomonas mosselii]|uniref:hypothetical protein n=1 Tax=Pseudomonas mosselii TaxID=78327 RepID=UPI0012FE18DF|nr:hypothetical protein [Pseudomonas mosselii]MDH1103711.1 hypothetical protein [Pseudomonas mosselii]MEA3236211.1 hypothetical protein [Pseudomonas mosselii]MEB5933056.1 hypothetical protein [Pseudomonas mosselii]UVN43136.1 hypothetical protein NW905_18700 [Pseudomonas mosselii]UWS68626.1 hypothetical protein N0U38_07495 [Pseudomonas mosselii]
MDISAKHEGRQILDIVECLGETEWRKGSTSTYVVKIHAGLSLRSQIEYPPSVCFRFVKEDVAVIAELIRCVDTYQGHLKWAMIGEGREDGRHNWVIAPQRLFDVEGQANQEDETAQQFLARNDPGFGKQAYEDMAGLVVHMKNYFRVG